VTVGGLQVMCPWVLPIPAWPAAVLIGILSLGDVARAAERPECTGVPDPSRTWHPCATEASRRSGDRRGRARQEAGVQSQKFQNTIGASVIALTPET
jgi:hypothetical protein